MNRREFLSGLGAAAMICGFGPIDRAMAAPARKPNFIFILMDDMGWADLGCYGSKYHETPNIDKLAARGMRFTQAYAACPVCSPTRASIMTGRYPARIGLTDWIAGHKKENPKLLVPAFHQELPLNEVTIAEVLKANGYATGIVGKWHLGGEEFYPEKQGFDTNFGGTHRGSPGSHFYPFGIANVTTGKEGEYLDDRLTDEAMKFLETNKDKPFFLYMPHYAVHTPLQAPEDLVDKYTKKAGDAKGQSDPRYAGMVENADANIGRLMKKLDDMKLTDNTVIIFMSDNGGLQRATRNDPLRGGKCMLYEGGIREPMFVVWPGVVKPGSTSDGVVTSTDFFPTMLEIAGITKGAETARDGISFVRLLKQTGSLKRKDIFWHYPHYHPAGAWPGGAIRSGDWKLIEYFEDGGRVELYNLKDDLGETRDLAREMPEKAEELRKKLAAWRKSVDARMPTVNPDYDPAKEKPQEPVVW